MPWRPQFLVSEEPARGTIVLVKIVKDKACRAPVRSSAIARCLTVNALERRRALLKIESQPTSRAKHIDIKLQGAPTSIGYNFTRSSPSQGDQNHTLRLTHANSNLSQLHTRSPIYSIVLRSQAPRPPADTQIQYPSPNAARTRTHSRRKSMTCR